MTEQGKFRTERDSMGEFQVPADVYYGANTMRAVLNFPISNLRFPRSFIRALGQIKMAAAQTNAELGLLPEDLKNAITQAAQEVVDGKLDDQFVVDIFQTGSGTSTNMNVNEVISNRAIEIMGGVLGSRTPVHPNDHVNIGQSSNDVIPTAIHVSALRAINDDLVPALKQLQQGLEIKSKEFMTVIKTGRTHLQDATPIWLGQEFLGHAGQMERAIRRVRHAQEELSEVALGGTAVGTGVNTHPDFAKKVCARLTDMLGVEVHETTNHFQAQNTLDNVVEASGALKTVAVSLMKICNDIRWLGSGPRAGIGEIELPEVQPGSSIMPGKVNPVIPESVCQVAAHVIGNDAAITVGGQSGNFEINVMMPVCAYNLLQSIDLLAAAARNLDEQCVRGLKATQKGPDMVDRGLAIVTTLVPHIGYDASAALAHEAQMTGQTVKEVALVKTNLSAEQLDEILDPTTMTEPGLGGVSLG
ncbi:MAG: aspartate ammonia-lyase [SAR202 cluster bacterium Casp-Chloro-G4]|nr:class II fumarate hydratase [Chloroflexota bacterium]MDA1227742.1 class II fumarate hydratase [Chloroflexota bacterium]PKB61543.1 MAG: aspartate ammonia-lyase [SAR202 cluster bacterium Casp-Chloro-G4]